MKPCFFFRAVFVWAVIVLASLLRLPPLAAQDRSSQRLPAVEAAAAWSPSVILAASPTGVANNFNEIPQPWVDSFGLSPPVIEHSIPLRDPAGQRAPGEAASPTIPSGPDNGSTLTVLPAVPGEPAATQQLIPLADPESAAQTIGEVVDDGREIDQPPLESEVIRWYEYPLRWMRGWENHAEFGLDGSSGNAETLAIQTGLEMRRKTDLYTLSLDIDYRHATANDITTEENGRLNLDYDRLLGDSAWTAFGKLGLEFDQFKVFDLRLNLNGGVGYYWIRSDQSNLVTRFGAGASKEFGAPDDDWIPEAVFGIEGDHQLTERQKIKAKLDYFPAWNDFGNYRLVGDVAWETLLDSSDNLSLRVGLTNRYDSTPQGARPNDFYYSVLLLYKF